MKYEVIEIFKSIQGEGFNIGREVVFLRLAGCNRRCQWCDTEFNNGINMSLNDIIAEINKENCMSVIITGGEPCMQNLRPLLLKLRQYRYWIGIETNGDYSLQQYRPLLDYITVSPKGMADIKQHDNILIDELRIVYDKITVEYIEQFNLNNITVRYISPCEQEGIFNLEETIKFIAKINIMKGTGRWNLSLQLHKILGIR